MTGRLVVRGRVLGQGVAQTRRIPQLQRVQRGLSSDDTEDKISTVSRDEDLAGVWVLDDTELEGVWDRAHDKSIAHSTPFVIEEVVRLTINLQREKLAKAIEDKEAKGAALEEEVDMGLGIFSALTRWKRWGLTMQAEDCADELHAAKLLLEHLQVTDEAVGFIMEALGAEEGVIGDTITKEKFMEVVHGGALEQEELDVFLQSLNASKTLK